MAERRFFGTDGVGDRPATFLTAELATRLGRAAALESERRAPPVPDPPRHPRVGADAGVRAGRRRRVGRRRRLLGGVLPTPAASILTRRFNFDVAAMISASHNPYEDNGIKFFDAGGDKLDDEAEAEIEARLDDAGRRRAIGRVRTLENALDDYLRELRTRFPLDLSGRKVAARLRQRRHLPRRAGDLQRARRRGDRRRAPSPTAATSTTAAARPTSRSCAERWPRPAPTSASPSTATATGCWRSTASGRVHDGDELIGLIAHHLQRAGELDGGVAVTVMSNYGFHQAMEEAGIEIATTAVGDRYVLEALRREGLDPRRRAGRPHHLVGLRRRPATASAPPC